MAFINNTLPSLNGVITPQLKKQIQGQPNFGKIPVPNAELKLAQGNQGSTSSGFLFSAPKLFSPDIANAQISENQNIDNTQENKNQQTGNANQGNNIVNFGNTASAYPGGILPQNLPQGIDTSQTQGNQGQNYLDNVQNLKNNSVFDPITGGYSPYNQTTDASGRIITSPQTNINSNAPLTLRGLVPQLLANAGANPAVLIAQQNLQELRNQQAQKLFDIEGHPGLPLNESMGQTGLANRLFAAKETAAQQALANAQQEQQIQQAGLGAAIGAVAPQLGAAGQVPYAPATGEQGNILGGQGGGFDINGLAQDVLNGQRTIDQANSMLGNNIALVGSLRSAILSQNPNFNFSLSSASGATQAAGQQVKTGQQTANQALDTLQNSFNNLGPLTATSVPFINQLTQGISMGTGIGREQTSAFLGALNEARGQVQAILSTLIGVDAAGRQTNNLLPDNMIPSEIPQRIAAAKQYIQQRVDAFTQSGQQQNGNSENLMFGKFNG